MMPSVEYLGHQVSAKGIQPESKVRAIKEAPVPTDVTKLHGVSKLLWQVFVKFVFKIGSLVCFTTERFQIEIGNSTGGRFFYTQVSANL